MALYYQCLQCGNEFKLASGKTEGKFCCGDPCYKEYRKAHGTQAVKDAPAIFVREEVSKRTGRPKAQQDPKETNTAPLPSNDNKNIEQEPNEDPESQQNASIDFEDLSIIEIRELVQTLLIQNEKLQSEVQHLSLIIDRMERSPSPLKEIVNTFLRQLIKMEIGEDPETPILSITPSLPININKICAAPNCKNPVDGGRIFCSKKCALSVLPKNGVMLMNDGELIKNA